MIYFDYSATTPVDERVLEDYVKNTQMFIGNSNSEHVLGREASFAIKQATNGIKHMMNLNNEELIFTSGATEANNLALIGYALKHKNEGMHLIMSPYEHSSVVSSFSYLEKQGFEVDVLSVTDDGLIDLDELSDLLREDTILVSIALVSSEVGYVQNPKKIKEVISKKSSAVLHSDVTQAIGKTRVYFPAIDLATFSAHKFYGLKGIGCLIRKESVELQPLLYGGHSLSPYRPGTPPLPLILSVYKALSLVCKTFDQDVRYVETLKTYLVEQLSKFYQVIINSNENAVPHIVNFSFMGLDAKELQRKLSEKGIYLSTQSACTRNRTFSPLIYAITKNEERAMSSLRLSLSKRSKVSEIDQFIQVLKEVTT